LIATKNFFQKNKILKMAAIRNPQAFAWVKLETGRSVCLIKNAKTLYC
jgi:hypothetical protein